MCVCVCVWSLSGGSQWELGSEFPNCPNHITVMICLCHPYVVAGVSHPLLKDTPAQ